MAMTTFPTEPNDDFSDSDDFMGPRYPNKRDYKPPPKQVHQHDYMSPPSNSCKIWERKVNIEYLVSGYSRSNINLSFFVPSTVLNVISYYYPSMNGYTFIWHLTNIQDLLQSKSNVIDSDVFNIGLSNKFFLRLKLNSSAIQTSVAGIRSTQIPQQRLHPYNDNRNRAAPRTNNPSFSFGGINNHNNNYNNNNELETKDDNKINPENASNNLLLTLMSFPLRKAYLEQKLHCELYCHEIKGAQYSAIWTHKDGEARKYNDYNPPKQQQQHNIGNVDIYIQHGWVINYDLQKYRQNKLTIECKINVLQVLKHKQKQHSLGHSQYDEGKVYNYIALPFANGKTKNMKFTWNIMDKSIVDRLTGYSNYKGIIQYHSDIFYDMFQLQIGRLNDKNYFQYQICGLPKNTDKISVKLQLFVSDMNNKIKKIQIMSNVVTFSYYSPLYTFSHEQINLLIDILSQYKNLSLLCVANIIHKYDISGKTIQDNTQVALKQKNDTDKINNEEIQFNHDDIKNNDTGIRQWLKFVQRSCVWHVSDTKVLNKLKKSFLHSTCKPFQLCRHKWYINCRTQCVSTPYNNTNTNQNIVITLHCLTPKIDTFYMSKITLLQTGDENMYYGTFSTGNTNNSFGGHRNVQQLSVNKSKISKLNKLSIKITIGIIKTNDESNYNDDIIHRNDENNEIKRWLSEKVGLPQYYPLFKQQGIDELNIVKLLPKDAIWAKGIKYGHHLKIMDEINKLKEKPKHSECSAPTKEYWIAVISICISCFCLLCQFYSALS
eukprot:365970_1